MNEQQLARKALKNYEAVKKRKKSRYTLARHLGFTTAEAMILAGRSEEEITRLWEERQAKASIPSP